jgi:hypothetical protein
MLDLLFEIIYESKPNRVFDIFRVDALSYSFFSIYKLFFHEKRNFFLSLYKSRCYKRDNTVVKRSMEGVLNYLLSFHLIFMKEYKRLADKVV